MAKLQNSKIGLANSLRGFGTGLMPYLGNEIKKMNFPVLLITGGLDSKFTKLNKVLFKQFPNAEHKIAESVGHNFHFEKPEEFKNEKGQYAILNLKDPKITELDLPYRWLPMASNGEDNHLRFHIKQDGSSFSKSCELIDKGDEAVVFGPIG